MADAVFAVLYFLHWQLAMHGHGFAARKHKDAPRPRGEELQRQIASRSGEALRPLLLDFIERHQFRGVRASVPAALAHWLRGDWALELREDVPAPSEVLRAQARGTRVATAISSYPRLLQPVLTKPNAFAFFVHDLEHAYKFFHDPALYAGQRAFFATVAAALAAGTFAVPMRDPVFVAKFQYLMSDMNTHPEHSRQYLRAILIEFYLRREGKPLDAPLSTEARTAVGEAMRAFIVSARRVPGTA